MTDKLKNKISDSELDKKVSLDIAISPSIGNSLFLEENDQIFLNESSGDTNIDIYPGVKLRLTFLNMSENSGHCSKCRKDFDQIKNHKNIFHRRMEEKWCDICGRLFSKISNFHEHLKEHQTENNITGKECYICQIQFDDLKKFKKHMERHSCLHVHLCDKCSKTFMFRDNYIKHMLKVHDEEPPAINQTGELSFNETGDEAVINLHEKTREIDSSAAMNVTDDDASTVLEKSATIDDDEIPNSHDETTDGNVLKVKKEDPNSFCFKCSRNFSDFKSHEYIFHRNKNQLICEVCGRQFYKNKLYQSHKIDHKKNRMKCYVCNNKKFDSLRPFLKHLEQHDELHVFYCSECNKSFAVKSNFDCHLKKRHNRSKKDDCLNENSPDKSGSNVEGTDVVINTRIQYSDNLTNDSIDIVEPEKTTNRDDDKSVELTPIDLIKRIKRKEKIKMRECKVESARSAKTLDESQFDDEDLDISDLDKSKDQICYVCGEKFAKGTRYNVYNHWLSEHNDYLRECKICDKKIVRPSHLYFHSMKHDDKYPWPCSKCNLKCKNYFALKTHIACTHQKIEKHVCKICKQKFVFSFTYICHLRMHNEELKFKCHYCPLKCHWKRILIPHLKPRRCKYCEIDLPCRTLYDDHFRNRHMNEKLFDCQYCRSAYPTKPQLRRHYTISHLDLRTKKIEYCSFCDFMTNNKRNLNRHIKSLHNN